jgi:hypothetical protein
VEDSELHHQQLKSTNSRIKFINQQEANITQYLLGRHNQKTLEAALQGIGVDWDMGL